VLYYPESGTAYLQHHGEQYSATGQDSVIEYIYYLPTGTMEHGAPHGMESYTSSIRSHPNHGVVHLPGYFEARPTD
jgi:hypothetical protein